MAFLKPWFFLGPGGHDPGSRLPHKVSSAIVRDRSKMRSLLP